MTTRGPDSILCAHCGAAPGAIDCPGCSLLVCDPCSRTRAGCSDPQAIEVRLGMGARLRSVDPTCRWGLATTWQDRPFRVDLDRLVHDRPRADRSGAAIDRRGDVAAFRALDRAETRELRIAGDEVRIVELDAPLAALDPLHRTLTPFRRKSINAVACDGDRVACAGYAEIGVWAVEGGERLFRVKPENIDAVWVGIGGDVVAALLAKGAYFSGDSYALGLWRISSGAELARVQLGKARQPLADISGGGERAAAADERSNAVVIECDTLRHIELGGHSDGLSALRLSTDGSRLVTGDHDNRVIIRDRGSRGFPSRIELRELTRE